MKEEEFEELIRKSETEEIEFKESLKLKDEIGQTISSFSNMGSGKILVGIKDSGKVIGVDLGENTLEKLANYIKRNTDPSIYPSLSTKKINGEDIVIIDVEESSEKPVFFKGKAYKRVGKADHKLKSSEIRKLAKDSGEKVRWDEQICEEASLEDIDEEEVKEFLKTARRKRDFEIEYDSVEEALRKLKLLKDEGLTNASVLMFVKDPQKFFLQDEVKCGRFEGTTTKEFIDMKEFSGPVHEQVDDAEKFLLNNIKKAAWIEPGKVERQERWEYPMDSVREALTNAIVHRDYQSSSKVQVRIFDDRIEIWNPGTLPEGWTVETLKKEHESKPFNPLLAKMFFLIKYIEEWGRGTTDMVQDCLDYGLPEPEFKDTGTSIVVTFRKSRLTEEYFDKLGLNERQRKAIEYIKEQGRITSGKYQKMFDVSRQTVHRDMSKMIDSELLKRKGKGKETYYVLRHKYVTNTSQNVTEKSKTNEENKSD